MKAKIYKADTPNANGLIYPRKVLEEAVEKYNKQESRLVTFEDYPGDQSIAINFEDVIGEATLSMEGDYVTATVKMLDTPAAARAKTALDKGYLLPSGTGSVVQDSWLIDEGFTVAKLVVPHDSVETGEGREEMFVLEDDDET